MLKFLENELFNVPIGILLFMFLSVFIGSFHFQKKALKESGSEIFYGKVILKSLIWASVTIILIFLMAFLTFLTY